MGDLDFKNGLINAIYILSSRIEQVPIRQFVAAVFAETIYNNTWEVVTAQPLTERIAHLIKNKCNKDARQYNKLKEYNREGLYLLIETEWGLQNCENYISTDNRHWAYEYDASLNQVLLNKFIDKRSKFEESNGRQYPIQIAGCGKLDYNPISASREVFTTSNTNPVEQKTTNVSRKNSTIPSQKATRIKDELLSLYTKLVSNRGGEDVIDDFEYIWQWKVSEAEYNEIKKLLTSEECKNNIKNIITENKYCLLIVVIYIAENYKREYNGNDNTENELEQIGLRGKSKGIVTNYFGEASPKVLQSETHTWWIDTLRLEGGLPINYIQANDSNANNQLARFAVKLYEDTSEAIKILEEGHNNQAIRHSYNEGYSLRKYIEILLQEGLYGVCSEGDINNKESIFSEFKDILENGRKEAQKNSNKFAYKYRVWTFQDEFLIHRSIVFKQDSSFSESQELISRERLKQWGVEGLEANDIFWLKVDDRKFEFHPWGKDYYRSDVGLTEFPLPTARAPQYSMQNPKIYYIGKDGKEFEVESIVQQKAKYIKFTSDNGFDWMTGRSGELSSVLLLDSKVELVVENSEDVREVGKKLKWVEFFNRVKIDGKYIYSSKLNVAPKDDVMHPVTKSKFIRNISFFKDEEKCNISLFDSSMIKAKNFNIIGNNDEIEQTEVNAIKYKDTSTGSWKEYKGNDSPCGLVRLNIDGFILMAYILTHNAKITCRNHSEGRGEIAISNIDEIEAEGYELNPISDGWLLKDIYKEENKDRDSILFKIKVADDEYLTFEVIRPLKREDKMIGKHIVSADARIPRRLESKYRIRKFDENGVSYCDDRSSRYEYSSQQIGFAQNRYFIAKGISPEVDEKLEFVFISESLEEYKMTLSRETVRESGRDISYIYLDNIPQGQKGVIIQTLEHVMPDLTYYEPKWIGMGKRDFKTSTALKRLQITIKHKLYPNVLMSCNQINDERDEITPKLMIEYFAIHCSDCEEKQRDYDWHMLWEMADELGKDWLYITRRQWRNFATDIMPKELVCGLFMKRPKSSSTTFANFVQNYWSWKWVPRQGGTNEAYDFLKSVLGDEEENSNSWKYTGSFPAEESLKIQMDRLIGNNK